MEIEDIANELITLKEKAESLERNYQAKRLDMYNKLTNTQLDTFEHNGFKFTKTKEMETKNITKEKLWNALTEANIDADLRSQIFSDSQNETTRLSNIRISKLN